MKDWLWFIFFCFPLVAPAQIWQNSTTSAGIEHFQRSGSMFGGGVAVVDIDEDGWLDVVVTGGTNDDVIYYNNRNMTFRREIEGLRHNFVKNYTTTSVNYLDYNNDGCTDLLFGTLNPNATVILLSGDCQGWFRDRTSQSGLDFKGQTLGTLILDVNQDGLEDIYLLNYIEINGLLQDSSNQVIGFDHQCAPNILYINQGDGTFMDQTEAYNMAGCGCTLAAQQTEHDGQLAVLLANDFGEWLCPNEFFVLNGQTFEDIAPSVGLDAAMFGMGIGAADLNHDGKLDYYITNIGNNTLHLSQASVFYERADSLAIANEWQMDSTYTTGWGVAFMDADLDGDQDLFVANGYIPSAPFLRTAFDDHSVYFTNEEGVFVQSNRIVLDQTIGRNRGLAKGDFDNDGDEDLFLQAVLLTDMEANTNGQPAQLLENIQSNDHRWLAFRLDIDGRDDYGLRIKVFADQEVWTQHYLSGGSHASQHAHSLHFGLGAIEKVDSITIKWPNQPVRSYNDIHTNQLYAINPKIRTIEIMGCTNTAGEDYNPLATRSITCSSLVTAVSGGSSSEAVSVWPNPATDVLYAEFKNARFQSINISDLFGRQMVMSKDITIKDEVVSIDIKHLPSGLYVLTIFTDDQNVKFQKFIKS